MAEGAGAAKGTCTGVSRAWQWGQALAGEHDGGGGVDGSGREEENFFFKENSSRLSDYIRRPRSG